MFDLPLIVFQMKVVKKLGCPQAHATSFLSQCETTLASQVTLVYHLMAEAVPA